MNSMICNPLEEFESKLDITPEQEMEIKLEMDIIKATIEARKKLNITQKELAEQLSITDKAVSKWERGLCLPDISILLPLSQILGVNLYELLKGEKLNKNFVSFLHSTNQFRIYIVMKG